MREGPATPAQRPDEPVPAPDAFERALEQGNQLLQKGDARGACEVLEGALRLHPRHQRGRNLLGLALFKLGELQRSEVIYKGLIEDHPEDPTLRVNLGLVFLKAGAPADAARCFETALDLQPAHAKAQNYLGLALAQLGELGRAKECFLRCGNTAMAEKMVQAMGPPLHDVAEGAERALDTAHPFQPIAAERAALGSVTSNDGWVVGGPGASKPPTRTQRLAAALDALAVARAHVAGPDGVAESLPPPLPSQPPPLPVAGSQPPPLPGVASQMPPLPVAFSPPPPPPLPGVAAPLPPLPVAAVQPQTVPAPPQTALVASQPPPAGASAPPPLPRDTPLLLPRMVLSAPPPVIARTEPHAAGTLTAALTEYTNMTRLSVPEGEGGFLIGPTELVVKVSGEMLTRLDGMVASWGSIAIRPELKRFRGKATDKPFGDGARRMLRASGLGRFVIAREGRHFTALELDDEPAYFREEILFAFEESLLFENGRVPSRTGTDLHLVHLRGHGRLLLCTQGIPRSAEVTKAEPLRIPMDQLVGWHGPNIQPRLVPICEEAPELGVALELAGEGRALVDAPEEPR